MEQLRQEDVRKLHAEINQINNQRFLLTTLAVTMFGVVSAWLVPRSSQSAGPDDGMAYLEAGLLFVLLFLLYVASHTLRNVMRTDTTYLEVFELSEWEAHSTKYRAGANYFAYTKIQSAFFIALGILNAMITVLTHIASVCSPYAIGSAVLFLAYIVLIWGMGWRKWWDREGAARSRWQRIRDADGQSSNTVSGSAA
mgnify:CR=1 FL=1